MMRDKEFNQLKQTDKLLFYNKRKSFLKQSIVKFRKSIEFKISKTRDLKNYNNSITVLGVKWPLLLKISNRAVKCCKLLGKEIDKTNKK